MTSTNDGKEVKSNQTSGQKGKQYYISLYNSLDARLSAEQPLRARTQPLCEAWALVPTICRHALPDSHKVLLTWLERHTAGVILLSEWQSPASEDDRTQFADALAAVPLAARAVASPGGSRPPWETMLLERAAWFSSILDKPWDHPVLRALLVLEPTGEPPSDDEVLEWMSCEREVVLMARLRQLAASKECRELAAALATAICDRVRQGRHLVTDTDQAEDRICPSPSPSSFEARLWRAGFSKEFLALLADMELVLLLRADRRGKCIDVAKQTPLLSGYDLAQRLVKRSETAKTPREKKFWKNATDAARLIAQVVIARCMKVPRCVGAASKSVFRCGGLLAALSSGEAFRRAAAGLTAPAPTSHHLYCLARGVLAIAVKQKTMESMKTFICELYVRAITFGMNELEKLKLDPEKGTLARAFESTLSGWVGELGGAVGSARVAAECALTAFSLHPDSGNYRRVADAPELTELKLEPKEEPEEEVNSEFGSWATDSQTQSNLVKTSEHLNMMPTKRQANVLSTAIVSEGEALGLGVELCHDIATILSGPRVKTLSWDMDRGSLLDNCRAYMERTGDGTRAVTTELKFLNLDPSEYQHLPEEDDDESDAYYGIEKGYEHLVEFQETETETIWQDALSDFERTESACSNSQDGLSYRKKSKQRFPSTSESDCDPLSSVAEAKRLEQKQRPHSKERSRERRKSKKASSKKNDEEEWKEKKEKKDGTEKKERKKKKKGKKQVENIGALSSLIGVKVARVTSIDEGKTDKVKNVCVIDSDYDSQGKSSLNSEEIDASVIYDGNFSMDELKSPDRQVAEKVDGLDNRELSVSNGAISMNKPDAPPKRDICNTANAIATPTAVSCGTNPQSVQKQEQSEVKKKISKLLQFRRQNVQKPTESPPNPVQSAPKQETVKSELSSLVGSKIIQATDVPKVNATEVPKVKATEEPKLKATKAPKVIMTKKQSDDINVLTNKVNHLLARNNLPAGLKVLNLSSQPELTKNNLPAGMKVLNLSQPELMNMPNVKRKNARKNNETCSRVRPIQYDYTKRKSKPQNSAIMQDATLIQNVTNAQNTIAGVSPPCEYINVTSTVVPQANQSPIMSQTSPTLKESHTSLPSTKIQSIRNPVILQPPLNVLPPPSCTNLPDSYMTSVETPSLIPTMKPAFEAQQNNFQDFLKSFQGSLNAGMKSTNKTPGTVTPAAHTPCKTEQTLALKPVATQKKVENAPNTFARRSYMQKKQGKSVPAEQLEQIALQNSISAELDQRIAKLRHHKMSLNNNLLLTNQEVTKPKETNMARMEVQSIEEPTRLTPKDNLILNRLLTPSTLNMFNPVLGNENPTLEVKSIPRPVSSSVSSKSMLTEKDQQDLMLLLRQQSNINASNMQKRSEISSFNAVQIPNVPPVKVISSGITTSGIFRSKLISNPTIQIPVISNSDAIRTADMVQLNKNSMLQNIPKEAAINGPMNQKPATVSEKNSYNATHKKSSQDWSQVLDAIRAQKTPSRGPNALDMAMRRSSYEKYVNDNVKNNTVPNTSGSQCAPKQKPINKQSTIHTVPKRSNVQPIESKKPTQIQIPKKTYQPDMLKRQSDDYTKTGYKLQKGNDPFISGLENSDYDLLEELMDDELRQEIGELSDEDRYSSIKNPLSLPDQTSTKNNNTFNDPHKTGTSYKVIYDPRGLLTAQKDSDSNDKVSEKPAIKKGHQIKTDPQYVQSTTSEGTKIYKLSGKVETQIINSSFKPEGTAKSQMLPSNLTNSRQTKIVDTKIINSSYTPDDELKIQKLPGRSLKHQQYRLVETRTINTPYSLEVTPKIKKLPDNSSKTQPIKVLDTRNINPPYSSEITPKIQKLPGQSAKTQKMKEVNTKIINSPYTPDTRNVQKLPGNSTKRQQIKIVDSKVINPPYIQNMSTKESPKLQELLGTSSKSKQIKIMDAKIITPPYVQSTTQKDAPVNHKISGNTSKKSRVIHGTPKNLILPIKTDNNKQIYNSTQQVNNSILNKKLNRVTYDQAYPQKSDAKGLLITAVPKSAIGNNMVVIGAGGGALSVQPQQKTFVAISNAPNLILQPAHSPVLSPALIGNTITLPTTSQPLYASTVSKPVAKAQNLPTTSNLNSIPTSNKAPTIIHTPQPVKVEEKQLQHVPECRVDTKLKEPDVTADIPKMMSRSINPKVENMTQDKRKLCEQRVLSQVQKKLKAMPEIVVTKQPKMNKAPVENVASKDTANQERLKQKRLNIINREIKKPSQHPPIILSYSPLGLSKEKSIVKARPVVKYSGLTNLEDTHVNKTDTDIESEQSSEISNDTTKENKKNTQPRFLLRSCKKTMTTDSNKNVAIKTRVRLKTKSSDEKEADDSITETNEKMSEDDKLNINIIVKSPNVAKKDSTTQSPMRSSKRIRENRIKQQSAAEFEATAVCDTISKKLDNLPESNVEFDSFDIEEALTGSKIEKSVKIADALTNIEITSDDSIKRQLPNEKAKEIDMEDKKATCSISFPMSAPLKSDTEIQISNVEKQEENTQKCTNDLLSNMEEKTRRSLECNETFNIMDILNSSNVINKIDKDILVAQITEENNIVNTTEIHNSNNVINETNNDISDCQIIEKAPVPPENNKTLNTTEKTDQATSVARATDVTNNTITKAKSKTQDSVTEEKCKSFVELVNDKQNEEIPALCNRTVTKNLDYAIQDELDLDMDVEEAKPVKAVATFGKIMVASKRTTEISKNALKPSRKDTAEKNEHIRNCIPSEKPNNSNQTTLQTVTENFNSDSMDSGNNIRYTFGEVIVPEKPNNNIPNVRSISTTNKNHPRIMTATSDNSGNTTEKAVPLVEPMGIAKNNDICYDDDDDTYLEPNSILLSSQIPIAKLNTNKKYIMVDNQTSDICDLITSEKSNNISNVRSISKSDKNNPRIMTAVSDSNANKTEKTVPLTETTGGTKNNNDHDVFPDDPYSEPKEALAVTRTSADNFIRTSESENITEAMTDNLETLQSYKQKIKIEELRSRHVDSNKRSVRIELPNGKKVKATVYGTVPVSVDSLFENPAMKDVLLSTMKHTKRYSVSVQQLSTRHTNEIIDTVIQSIEPARVPLPTNNIETVNLISDDEEDTSHLFVTEFGTYTVNNIEKEIAEKHQTKFYQPCQIKLKRCDNYYEEPKLKLELNLIEDSPKVVKETVKLPDIIKNNILQKIVDALLTDTQINKINCETVAPKLNNVIEIEDSSSDNDSNVSETISNIDDLKNKLLKDFGVKALSTMITTKEAKAPQKQTHKPSIKIKKFKKRTGIFKRDYSHITKLKCCVKLIRCDDMLKNMFVNQCVTDEDTDNEDQEILTYSNSNDEPSDHNNVNERTSPVMDVFDTIASLRQCNEKGRNSPVMEVYDVIATLRNVSPANTIERTYPTMLRNCQSEQSETKRVYRYYKKMESIDKAPINFSSVECNFTNLGAPNNDLKISCDSEWITTKPNIHRLTLNAMDASCDAIQLNDTEMIYLNDSDTNETDCESNASFSLLDNLTNVYLPAEGVTSKQCAIKECEWFETKRSLHYHADTSVSSVDEDVLNDSVLHDDACKGKADISTDCEFDTDYETSSAVVPTLITIMTTYFKNNCLVDYLAPIQEKVTNSLLTHRHRLKRKLSFPNNVVLQPSHINAVSKKAKVEKAQKFESIQWNSENNLAISSDQVADKNDSESLGEDEPLARTENIHTDTEYESSELTGNNEKDEAPIEKAKVQKEPKFESIQCNTENNLTICSDPMDDKNDAESLGEDKPLPQTENVDTDSVNESPELTAKKENDYDPIQKPEVENDDPINVIIIEDSVELTLNVETKMKQTSDTILDVENLTEMNNEDDVVSSCENKEILNDHDEVEPTLDVETKMEETYDTILNVENLTEMNNEDDVVSSCDNEEILNDHDEVEPTLDVETKMEETSDIILNVENLTEMNNEDDVVSSCDNEEILNDHDEVEPTLDVETKMEETSDIILNVENLTEMNNEDDVVTSCENKEILDDHDEVEPTLDVETKTEETSDTILKVENLTEMNNEDEVVTSFENEEILNDQNHLTPTPVLNDEISEESKYLCNTEIFVEELSDSEIHSDTQKASIASCLKENANSGHAESNVKEIVNESISTETLNKAEPLDDPSTFSESHALQELDLEVLKPKVTYLKVKHIRKRKAIYNNMTDTYFVKRPRATNSKYRIGKFLQCPNLSKKDMAERQIYEKEYSQIINYISTVKFSFSVPFHKDYIDVPELLTDWPIKTCPNDRLHENIDIDNNLFIDLECNKSTNDPANRTLAEELSIENIEKVISVEKDENNFNVGFGEGSGRVIQNLANGGTMSTFSAATLSDVKHSQPFLLSVDHNTGNTKQLASNKNDEIEKIKRYATYIQMRETVRTFFKNRYMELNSDHTSEYKKDASSFPFDFYISNISNKVMPCPTEVIVQVVQVGQLPVSAAAQNPVTCDPRVTQVSNASPSQCSVDNSPHDESQPVIKTEYTELTTADFTLPIVQDYAQHNDTVTAQSQETSNLAVANEDIPIETELIKSEVKIELIEEPQEDLNMEREDQLPPANHVNNLEYSYETNTVIAESDQNAQFPPEKHNEETVASPNYHNGTVAKMDQIAHAMNAAGITTTPEPVPAPRAHTLVNILSQKMMSRQTASNAQNPPNNFPKTTPINAMSLQQALAQILPPPLNQTVDNNQQSQNHQVTSQVLHIVQGKNASGNQITLMDNSQPSVINTPNATPVLHIVQNKGTPAGTTSNGTSAQQHNTFTGLSLVDAGLQQGGNQLLHIVNTGNQKNNNAGQLLKRVNLLTNLANVQGSNEQKMVQFVCKSADGKSIQLNAPHQRSMVLRLQPIETSPVQTQQQTATKPADQEQTPTAATSVLSNNELVAAQQEIKSRSVYEENYAKFIQNSSNKPGNEKATSLPKFNQAFGKPVFQDGNQNTNEINSNTTHIASVNTNTENAECPSTDNTINLEHITQIGSPPLLLRKPAQTTQPQTNLVQHIKQTIAPMNIQTMHGGVIYTRQIPVNIGGGQTINLITVPSSEIIDDSAQKQSSDVKFVNQSEIEQSIIKIVPQSQSAAGSDGTTDENNHINVSNENTTKTSHPQPVLTQMRIKLPMLSKTPQMVSGTRIVRPSFFQIQRNVISGTNQPVYQQLVLTAAPSLGQQTIRLPQAQVNRQIKVPSESTSSSESQMSSSTLEQLREFDMVLEQVKERSTVQPTTSTNSFKLHTTTTDTNDNAVTASTTTTETTQQVLYSIGGNQPLNVAYVNRKATVTTPTTSTFVRSPDSSGIVDTPTSSHVQTPRTVTAEGSSSEQAPVQPKPHKASSKKSRPKSSNPPVKMSTAPPKTSTQKPLEDEQTTQRILYILAEYKEQVENSPDKDKPAPRRRTHPPSNPGSSKRKKGSRRNRDLSPSMCGDDTRTMGSEDSSCGTSQGDCSENCLEVHSPQDSPRKVARKLTFEQEQPPPPQPRPQPQRNVIVADGQTITVARGTAGKPTTAVLMPANYILPVSMVKGGQQIAIVTNRGPKLLTVGGGEGGATNALLLQRLIGPAGLKPMLRPGVRHVRLPTAALHNLQTFNLAAAAPAPPPDSTESPAPEPPPPELLEPKVETSPWTDRDTDSVKPDRASSPEGSEPWNLPSSADPHDYSYEETVRSDNLDRTVLDPIPDRYSPDMEAQRIFDKMFDVESKKSYIVDSQDDSPRCGYDIDASDEDKGYQVVHKKDHGSQRTRVAHVSAAALRHKYAILEHELRLQKSLSEECEDLGVDSPSAMELFPEAELLFAASPAHEHAAEPQPRAHTPQPILQQVIQPDIDDQIATDGPPVRERLRIGAIDHEEFARAHPNTTFHTEPDAEVQPFTISSLKGRHITSTIFHAGRAPATVVMATPAAAPAPPKYDLENMLGALPPSAPMGLAGARYDTMLEIPAPTGNGAQVIRRLCYDDRRRDRYLLDEPGSLPASPDRSPDRAADLFWESNSASERSDRRVLDYSSDSDKCCKSPPPSYDETDNTDSSGGVAPRLLSVIQQARRTVPLQELDTRPLRVYPAAPAAARSLSGKVRAGSPSPPAAPPGGRRRAPRAPRRACHCCAGDPPAAAAPPRKRPRHRKPPPEHH